MRCAWSVALWCSLVLSTVASAQSLQSVPESPTNPALSPEQQQELDAWLSEMEKWQRYRAKHDNRPARDAFGRIVPRRPPPVEPAWLASHCAAVEALSVVDRPERISKACALLVDPLPAAEVDLLQRQVAQEEAEAQEKYRSFLTRLHLDGAWVTTSSGPRAYGIVGFHMTLVDIGRVQMFGPPGVILLSVPDGGGNRRMTLGYTWGLSVRLADLRVSSPTANLSLFLTMSKVWVNGDAGDPVMGGSAQIVGFSLAPRKKP